MTTATPYTLATRLAAPLPEARTRVEAALKAEGFGILTEIDVQATMRAKLGVELEPFVILGACNPPLAHRAISAEPSVATLLPCNVVLREDGDGTIVEAMDPGAALSMAESAGIEPVAREARERLLRALDSLERE